MAIETEITEDPNSCAFLKMKFYEGTSSIKGQDLRFEKNKFLFVLFVLNKV